MGTNCAIIAKTGVRTYKVITVNFDGYPDHAGRMLVNHYSTKSRIEALIALGNPSSLQEKTSEGYCVAYGRDRFEEGENAEKYTCTNDNAFEDMLSEYKGNFSYTYFWDIDDGWRVYLQNKWVTVESLLKV